MRMALTRAPWVHLHGCSTTCTPMGNQIPLWSPQAIIHIQQDGRAALLQHVVAGVARFVQHGHGRVELAQVAQVPQEAQVWERELTEQQL